ncbi:MAG: hypothetical protein KJ621_08630 [Proteobacteria bacterium]|nr:hypothetical protein [Pseudomonadota bacterium]
MGSRAGLTAVLVVAVMVLGTAAGGWVAPAQTTPAAKKKPDWPTMPQKKTTVKPPGRGKPTVITPTEVPGLIARAQKAFGLSIVLRRQRHDFYSEDVKRVVIGLDAPSGRIIGVLVIKSDETWGLYAGPRYLAFFPNKRAQARRAELLWLTAKGWATYLARHVRGNARD